MMHKQLITLLEADARRMQMLKIIQHLELPHACIAAGAIRNLVWDHLHGFHPGTPLNDIDVIYYDPQKDEAYDYDVENQLNKQYDNMNFQVRNQARMHIRNDDHPYQSVEEAMSFWPETATAVGTCLNRMDQIEIIAPHGIQDLFDLVLRRSPYCTDEDLFLKRVYEKKWLEDWPLLKIVT